MKRRLLLLFLAASIFVPAAASLAQQNKFHVLALYSKKTETDHVQFAQQALQFFTEMAKINHFELTASDQWDDLNAPDLLRYRVILWLNDSPQTEAQRRSFERYMTHGGGWLGFHASGYNDKDTHWPWFVDFLGDAIFYGNNWPPLPAKLRVDDRSHPVTRGMPEAYTSPANEWYIWDPDPRNNPHVKVLLTLDPSNYPLGLKDVLEGGDLPVVWTNMQYRMLYINMGHGDKIFTDAIQNELFSNSLLWLGAPVDSVIGSESSQSAISGTTAPGATALIDAGKFGQAAELLKTFLQTNSQSASAHQMLAYCFLRLNDPKQSLEQYTLAAAIAHPTADDLQNVSKDYVLLSDMSSAERWIRASLEMDDRAPESWYVFGRIRYTQRRLQDAVDCFTRVLALLPRSVKAEDNLGLAYEALNRRDDAVAAYRQAIAWQKENHSSSEQPLLNLGILLMREGNLEEARPLLSEAATIAPNNPRTREQLGHLYIDLRFYTKAQSELEEAVKLDPKKASFHFLLGRAYHLGGNEEKARKEFTLSSALSGEHSTPEGP